MELKLPGTSACASSLPVLIVLYGIETIEESESVCNHRRVLIVLYGIETVLSRCIIKMKKSLNRTLWN